jgi:hypothetical protein
MQGKKEEEKERERAMIIQKYEEANKQSRTGCPDGLRTIGENLQIAQGFSKQGCFNTSNASGQIIDSSILRKKGERTGKTNRKKKTKEGTGLRSVLYSRGIWKQRCSLHPEA